MESPIDATYSESNLSLLHEHDPSALALPTFTPEQAKHAMQTYIELCQAILTNDDYQEFWQWDSKTKTKTKKKFLKKSGVKKLQTFFGISVRIKETCMDQMGDGHFGFRVTATATKKNGDTVESSGACSTLEERFGNEKARARAYHDVLSTAETRASGRAVMSAIGVGGGEVTADEMPPPPPSPPPPPKPEKDHTVQLRYAYNAYMACFPQADKSTVGVVILNDIRGHYDLQETPQRSSDVTAEQLKWAGDYYTLTKRELEAEHELTQAVPA